MKTRFFTIILLFLISYSTQAQDYHNGPIEFNLLLNTTSNYPSGFTAIGIQAVKQGVLDSYNSLDFFIGSDINVVNYNPKGTAMDYASFSYQEFRIFGGPAIITNYFGKRVHPFITYQAGLFLKTDSYNQDDSDEESILIVEIYDFLCNSSFFHQVVGGVNFNVGSLDSQGFSDYIITLKYIKSSRSFDQVALGMSFRF